MTTTALPYQVLRRAVAIGSLAFAAACGSSTETATAPSAARCGVSLSLEGTTFPPEGGNGSLRITTARECTWSARGDAPWVQLSTPATGQGDAVLAFTIGPNDTSVARNSGIIVNEQRQALSQGGRPCGFRLSSTLESVAASGGERTIEVSATARDCPWTASAEVPWILVTGGREGMGDGEVRFRIEPAAGVPRTGTVTIARQDVRVQQGTECSYTVTPAAFNIGGAGASEVIQVAAPAECAWTAVPDQSWIRITSGASGSGPGSVHVTVAPTTGAGRAGVVAVAGRTVQITQGSGCAYSLSPSSHSVPAAGGRVSTAIATAVGCSWTPATLTDWLRVATPPGNGPGSVQVDVPPNTGPARSGTVTIGGQALQIAQASGCSYTLSPQTLTLPGGGGSAAVTLAANAGCPWTASGSADWIRLANATGSGPAQIQVTAGPNLTPARNGVVTIAGATVAIGQPSQCTFEVVPPSAEFDASGGTGSLLLIVSGPCTWTATTSSSWIRLTGGTSGTGNGLVQFTVPPNPGGPRTDHIVIAGQSYVVSQR